MEEDSDKDYPTPGLDVNDINDINLESATNAGDFAEVFHVRQRMGLLLDVNLNAIGLVAIHVQHHINFATASQAARDAQIELIQPFKSALRPGEKRLRPHPPKLDHH